MNQNIEIIDLGFSCADATNISFQYKNEDLVLSFLDWQEKPVSIRCKNLLGFKIQRAEYYISNSERDDSSYLVKDSNWVKAHVSQGSCTITEKYYHYKINFNACCVVEVLCTKLTKI